jgi:hypothetical protein
MGRSRTAALLSRAASFPMDRLQSTT